MPWASRARLPLVLLAGVFGSSVPRSRPRVPSGTNSGGVPMRKLGPRSACALPLGALAVVVMMSFPLAAARAEEPAKQPSSGTMSTGGKGGPADTSQAAIEAEVRHRMHEMAEQLK